MMSPDPELPCASSMASEHLRTIRADIALFGNAGNCRQHKHKYINIHNNLFINQFRKVEKSLTSALDFFFGL